MKDYQPLDLSALCNAGLDVLEDGASVPIGEQTLRGLPFVVGSSEAERGEDYLLPRNEGEWSDAGRRQTEVLQSRWRGFFLWSWENPEPDTPIESLEVVPTGARFVMGAITLGGSWRNGARWPGSSMANDLTLEILLSYRTELQNKTMFQSRNRV